VIVDTSALLAFFNAAEPQHSAVRAAIESEKDLLVVSPYVLAELDYLVTTRIGVEAELAVLDDLSGGAWEIPAFERDDIRAARSVIARHCDQAIGLADASIVILARRYGTRRVATLDRRHFTALRPLSGGRFSIVP
jgi:predicted nucleic acid-binding protein